MQKNCNFIEVVRLETNNEQVTPQETNNEQVTPQTSHSGTRGSKKQSTTSCH